MQPPSVDIALDRGSFPSLFMPHPRPKIVNDTLTGGTFTDCWASGVPNHGDIVFKVLSVDPAYPDAPTEAIRRVLELARGSPIARSEPLDVSSVRSIRMGTTVATNALLERKGEKTAFLVTKGFKDILEIGNQNRPSLFDLTISRPKPLASAVLEVDERVLLADTYLVDGLPVKYGSNGEAVQIERSPGREKSSEPSLFSVRTDLIGGVRAQI
jgi:5-oxoprolinase (ATP-hydrolysing)